MDENKGQESHKVAENENKLHLFAFMFFKDTRFKKIQLKKLSHKNKLGIFIHAIR